MFSLAKRLYLASPPIVKSSVKAVPYAWLAGANYRKTIAECRIVDKAKRADLLAMQERLLGDALNFAVREVPFYKKHRAVVEKYKPFDALREFPLLSKEIVQQNIDALKPDCIDQISHHVATTGGSSGNQLSFFEDDATYAKEMGFMHSQWGRVGYSPDSRKATFRGVKFATIGPDVFWQENPIHNELQFSPFHMSDENLALYVKKMIEYAPEFLHGYPSGIDVVAEYVIRKDLCGCLTSLKGVFMGSEACSDSQRARIEKAFARRIYTWYGQSERIVLAGECEHAGTYHSFPNYGYLEIVREDGEPANPGERGEIVGTGFINRSMPLVRYRTDDSAVRLDKPCRCGREWDLFGDVVGRWNLEAVYGKSGAKISASALNMHGVLFENAVRYQYCQNEVGKLIVRVVPTHAFSEADEQRIIREHQEKLWGEMDVSVERVQAIPLTSNGKQRRIICNVVR